jgi:PAS domain S-box-containing protein
MNIGTQATSLYPAQVGTRGWSSDELVDAIRDCAIVEVNRFGIIVGWNAGATSLFGYTKTEALGRPVQLLSAPTPDEQSAGTTSPRFTTGGELRTKNGPIRVSQQVHSVRATDGEIVGSLHVYRVLPEPAAPSHSRLVHETPQSATFLVNAEQTILDASQSVEAMFGYARTELLGQRIGSVVAVHGSASSPRAFGSTQEVTINRRDGSSFSAEITFTQFELQGHIGATCVVRDVSARAARDADNERLLKLVEFASDFVGVADAHGHIIYQNAAANRALGYVTLEEVRGRHLAEMHPPWAAQKIAEQVLPIALRDGTCTHETVLLNRDGTEIPVSQTVVIHRNDKGEVEYGSTIMRDLRGQKRVEALLANVAQHVRGMLYQFHRTADGVSSFPYASPGAFELYGLSPEELRTDPKRLKSRIHAADLERVVAEINKSQEQLTTWSVEYRYLALDGSIHWHRGESTPVRLSDGSTLWHGFIHDATQEHVYAYELAQSKLQFEQAIAALDHGFAMYDVDEKLIVCNDAYAGIYGISDKTRQLRPKYEDLIRMTIAENPAARLLLPNGVTFEQWISQRLLEFRTNVGHSEQHLGNRWIRVDERKTVTGGTVCVRTDITELKLAEFEARVQQERLRVATKVGGFGVWEWELADGNITWDTRMCELYDYELDEFPGTYAAWKARVHPDDIKRVEQDFERSVNARREFKSRYRVVKKDGTVRYIDAQGACVLDGSGNIIRVVGVNQDTTEEVESQEVLKRHAEAAEAATKAKAEFLATMSHEIRTPMNGVIGMTNLLIGTSLDGAQREYVETIRACGESLLSLINNIMDFSKMEAGKLILERVPFSLDQAVVQSIMLFTSQAEAKGIQLLHTLPADPVMVVGDPTRFKQILLNLVSNALKFTTDGFVKVSLQTHRSSDSETVVELQVADTGIGISGEHLIRLGEAFLQADASTTRQYGGTGLGLSITLSLIQKMNGNISVASEVNKGTTFSVRLPLGLATHVEAQADGGSAAPINLRIGRVLVAEDNAVNRRVVGLMLKKLAEHVDFATDGRQALELFMHNTYDCILMDGQMPEMDGFEATRQMRIWESRSGRVRTPIVALTANALPGDREAFLCAGMDEYLTKPLRNSDLVLTLAKMLQRASRA